MMIGMIVFCIFIIMVVLALLLLIGKEARYDTRPADPATDL
jgi:uncharacterized membrane protein